MLRRNDLERAFGTIDELGEATYCGTIATRVEVRYYYFRLDLGRARGNDILMVSKDRRDDDFALSVFRYVPLSFHLMHISILDIPPVGVGFNALLVAPSTYHVELQGAIDNDRDDLSLCIPIYRCEFSGTESAEEFRYLRILISPRSGWTADWSRTARPKIHLRFYNPKFDYGTPKEGTFTDYRSLVHALDHLAGVNGGFLDVTNYKGEVVRITPLLQDSFLYDNKHGQEVLDLAAVRHRLDGFLTQ